MIFRLSQKLSAKIKAGTLGVLPLDGNPFADWSAHVFAADRAQYVIVCNTKSLYSTVMYGKGITRDRQFIDRALGSIREFMEADGQEFTYRRLIAPTCGTVRFAKTLNRSVTGSLNDMIFHATMWLIEGEMSPHDLGFKLNGIPVSSLSTARADSYCTPREVFTSLVSTTGS
jgi:hypothetical protein